MTRCGNYLAKGSHGGGGNIGRDRRVRAGPAAIRWAAVDL